MGGEDFVKNGRQQYKCKACDISSTNAPSCPRLSPSACKAAHSPPFFTPPVPDDLLCPPSAVVRLNPETSRTTSCTKLPSPVPSHTRPPPPLSSETVFPTPPPPSSALAPASIPLAPLPNLCLPTAFIRPASYHFTHRYAHNLFHPLPSLSSPQHPQRLPSLGYPSLYRLLVKLVKPLCWMLSSSLQ